LAELKSCGGWDGLPDDPGLSTSSDRFSALLNAGVAILKGLVKLKRL